MSVLKPSPVSTDRFTYVAAERLLVAEASDLPPFGRVYDDACDEGLTLVSADTGREVVFGVEQIDRDREGDLVSWTLLPVDRAACPCKVVVYND